MRWVAPLALVVSACGGAVAAAPTPEAVPAVAPTARAAAATTTPAPATPAPVAAPSFGASIELAGVRGARIRVRPMRLSPRARGYQTKALMRVACLFAEITNTGTTTYRDAPGNGGVAILAGGREVIAGITDHGGCDSTADVALDPGQSTVVRFALIVPDLIPIRAFRFGASSGYGQAATWPVTDEPSG